MNEKLYDPARHEPLRTLRWDEDRVRTAIERIVVDTEARYSEDTYWPVRPRDRRREADAGRFHTSLYDGACGVVWALDYLQDIGAVRLSRSYAGEFDRLLSRNREWLGSLEERERASFLMGDTPIWMMAYGAEPTGKCEATLATLIGGNIDHPARELMWGAPGTMLAALFLHERTGNARWADLFLRTADKLWSELEWSPEHQCAYWTQRFAGGEFTYFGAVHGFVATALPLIRGRHLLGTAEWDAWERCIVNTVRRTAQRVGAHANWRLHFDNTSDADKRLLQVCHGAPGFVVCLAGLPGTALDDLLLAAGELIWTAGPLTKGANLCHGTGGNGYAFLKLHQRTHDVRWLQRARAFAMHGLAQSGENASSRGQSRYSLWTGDLGFAIYLWDCLRAQAQFPTLDIFFAG